jgi:hypothetical protein
MGNYWHENQTDHIIKQCGHDVAIYDNRAGGTHNILLRNGLD